MSTEQLLSSKIAGGRRINLLDNTDWIDRHKDKYWMGFNETCAYLHAGIADAGENGFGIEFEYDDHYCKYFEDNPSRWTLEMSDTYLENLGSGSSILIDGEKAGIELGSVQVVEIPAGLGIHKIGIVQKLEQ